jgi:futalosine hydrolase
VNILIAAATEYEISFLKEMEMGKHKLDFLIMGVGMVATTYSMTKKVSQNRYNLAINCGIAGSFDKTIMVGETVLVTEDYLSEMGAEDGNNFLRLKDMNLTGNDFFKSTFEFPANKNIGLRKVKAITVNTVHGNESSIEKISNRLKPQVESMEGAAFFFVCENENIPSLQVRGISNYVEKRNRELWDIQLALKNLKENLTKIIREI